jgi:predicted flavoprotein YhiN
MTATPENHDAIVLGAGAAGLFAQALRGNGAQR